MKMLNRDLDLALRKHRQMAVGKVLFSQCLQCHCWQSLLLAFPRLEASQMLSRLIERYGYGSIPINTIFKGMTIHLPAILMFTRGTRFWPTAIWVSIWMFCRFHWVLFHRGMCEHQPSKHLPILHGTSGPPAGYGGFLQNSACPTKDYRGFFKY